MTSNSQLPSPHPASPLTFSNMDYSYVNSAPQPYQYFGLPPTPGVGQPADMDSFGHPQPQQPTPFNSAFAAFQDSLQYEQSTFMPHMAVAQSQIPSRAPSRPMTNPPSISPGIPPFEAGPISTPELNSEGNTLQRSSSEEKDNRMLQPSKRKAQNRAAQRAFRERKERRMKDLETKLNDLEQQAMSRDSENERLRKALAQAVTEVEILRATSSGQPILGEDDDGFDPLGYVPADFATSKETAAKRAQMLGGVHTIVIDDHSGELLLNSGRTWDYIQAHEAFRDGLIDVGDVIDQLKKMARCDGQGPVFRECDIRRAISESAVAGGRDELL